MSDITSDAKSSSHVPSLPPPGRPRQKRTRSSASGRLFSLPTMLCSTDLSQRPRFGGEWASRFPCGAAATEARVLFLLPRGQIPWRCPTALKSGRCHLSPQCPPRNKLRRGAAKRRSRKRRRRLLKWVPPSPTHASSSRGSTSWFPAPRLLLASSRATCPPLPLWPTAPSPAPWWRSLPLIAIVTLLAPPHPGFASPPTCPSLPTPVRKGTHLPLPASGFCPSLVLKIGDVSRLVFLKSMLNGLGPDSFWGVGSWRSFVFHFYSSLRSSSTFEPTDYHFVGSLRFP